MTRRCGPAGVLAATLVGLLLAGCGERVQTGTAVTAPVTLTPVAPVTAAVPKWLGTRGAAMTNADASAENAGGADESFRFLVTPTVVEG